MAQQDQQDRNLPASPRKLQKAREEGNVPRSQDFGHFAAMTIGGLVLVAAAPSAMGWLKDLLATALRFDALALSSTSVMTEQLSLLTVKLVLVVIPMGLIMVATAVLGSFLIGGWNFTWKALSPKFEKISPLSGIVRMFSKQQFITAVKASVLALLLGVIGMFYLMQHLDAFVNTLAMPLPAAMAHVGSTVLGGLLFLVLLLAMFALVDAPLQRYLHANRLKMSHQEVKKEHKELEGNAEVKGRMRQLAREMSQRRMMAAVPTADLVVMNPTHYAVALKYDEAKMGAPRVVAKGADLLAMAIREAAKGAQVPVLQAPMLARALYAHAEIDREIPAALFAAVAQVLAYVYQLRAALKGQGALPGDLPELNVPPELDPLQHKNRDEPEPMA